MRRMTEAGTGTTETVEEGGFSLRRHLPYDMLEAQTRTREALHEQGFEILSTIDVSATLQAKLGETLEPFVILGACNPPLTHRALEANREIGLLMPYNVVIRETADGVVVEVVDPLALLNIIDEPELKAIAEEARAGLAKALSRLPGRLSGG